MSDSDVLCGNITRQVNSKSLRILSTLLLYGYTFTCSRGYEFMHRRVTSSNLVIFIQIYYNVWGVWLNSIEMIVHIFRIRIRIFWLWQFHIPENQQQNFIRNQINLSTECWVSESESCIFNICRLWILYLHAWNSMIMKALMYESLTCF